MKNKEMEKKSRNGSDSYEGPPWHLILFRNHWAPRTCGEAACASAELCLVEKHHMIKISSDTCYDRDKKRPTSAQLR